MTASTALLLLGGLVVLVLGGELLVRGGSGLGRALGLSPLVVGLTVVAFATSAPELAVSVDATLSGSPGLAVGNVVGSNITNVLLVLGLAALLLPVAVRSSLVRVDVPVLVGMSVLLLLLALDGAVSTVDGLVLLALLVGYVAYSVVAGRRTTAAQEQRVQDDAPARPARDLALVVVGVGLLVLGARWLVSAATDVAQAAGLSELVVGLTVVAVGTSLPEIAASVVAALRGEREMALGNVLGSNVFNIGAVMGGSALLAPGGVPVDPAAVRFDLPVMVVVAVALLPVVFTGFVIARWEAALFLCSFAAYVAYLLLRSSEHDALPAFSAALALFVLPLAALTLAVTVAFEVRRRAGLRAGSAPPTAPGRTDG